jgi:hypothetical protein
MNVPAHSFERTGIEPGSEFRVLGLYYDIKDIILQRYHHLPVRAKLEEC